MAEYIKREMPDMDGSGERKCYYKVKTYSNLSSKDFVKKICYPGSGLSQGEVSKVICHLVGEMKRWLAEGHTVTIDELGTFSLSIGVMDVINPETVDNFTSTINDPMSYDNYKHVLRKRKKYTITDNDTCLIHEMSNNTNPIIQICTVK